MASVLSPEDLEFVERHWDPIDPKVGDPYGLYAELRQRCPVAHSDRHVPGGFWVISRYQDVWAVARDHDTFSNAGGITMPPIGGRKMIPLEIDPPLQLSYRGLLSHVFSPSQVARIEPRLKAQTADLVGAFAAEGSCELVSRFCERQPTLALWQEPFLGDPLPVDGTDDWVGAFQSWIHDLVHEPARTEAAAGIIAGYLQKVMADRRARPRDDIPSLLLQARIGDRCLSEDEVFDYLFMIFGAGVETTAAALGSMLNLLGRRPDLRRRLVTEPEILPTAVEELLRFLGPTQATRRTVLRPTEVRGVSMSAGDPVMLLWGAADRDEDEFPDADRCILDRFPNRHLAFGAGVHRCLGSNLARLEVRLSLQEFLRRIPDYEIAVPDDELEWAVGVDRSLRRLPIVF